MSLRLQQNRKGVTSGTSLPDRRRESAIEQKFVRSCRRYGGEAVKVGHSGWPDQAVVWDGGVTTWAELKAPGEEPEPHQEERIQKLRERGHIVHVIHNEAEMTRFISASLQKAMGI